MRGRVLAAALGSLFLLCSTAAAEAPVLRVEQGALRGAAENGVRSFKSVPFAAPPVGPLRWRPPAPAPAWPGVREASTYGASCPQPERQDGGGGGRAERQDEDCLNLNVWTPENARALPVMVWIHGGAHRVGSGTFPIYDGSALAKQGVVLVTINYRLGLLGYFAHPALTREAAADAPLGNYGMLDQLAALQWVQRNIAAFGGDPRNVTVFGESAGGASILYLLTNARAKGLFAKAIVESGGGLQLSADLASKEREGVAAAGQVGLPQDASTDAMRAEPWSKWVGAVSMQGLGFGPFVDGRLVTRAPWRVFAAGEEIDVPLLIGANSNEASVLSALGVPLAATGLVFGDALERAKAIYDAPDEAEFARQALGDAFFVGPARWAAAEAADGAPSYLYHFSYVAERRRTEVKGAGHGSEIPYVFGTLGRFPVPAALFGEADRAMSRTMSACWVAFARTGSPACNGAPPWPAYTGQRDALMDFGPDIVVRESFRKPQIDLLVSRFETQQRR